MPIVRIGDEYADADFGFLTRHLRLLDTELSGISDAIRASRDPDSEGLLDAGEYFIGHGLVAIQRYMTTVCAAAGTPKSKALDLDPILASGNSFAAAVNAGANYWKHVEEWYERQSSGREVGKMATDTIERIEAITPIIDYTCANILTNLRNGDGMDLSPLLPALAEWRSNVFDAAARAHASKN